MTNGHNKGPQFEPNPDAARDADTIMALMRAARPGDIVTYETMSALVGRPITSQDYAFVKARKALFEAEKITFDSVPTEGYRRRTNDAEFARAHRNRLGIHRRFKKARDENALVKRQEIDRQNRPLHDARTAFFSQGAKESHGNSIKASAKRVTASSIDRFLEAERKRLGIDDPQ